MSAADRNRLAPKSRVVALLHRRVEGVHVDMDDLAKGTFGVGHGAITLSYRPPASLGSRATQGAGSKTRKVTTWKDP
jgi:hypothetical protein